MKVFFTLFKKEMTEAWRDKKWIWLPIVISILAISQPISQYFLPEILEHAGNMPEGTVIELPTPTGAEVLAGTLSQIGIIGTAIFVLSVMGTIAHERNSGAISLIMARPVHALQYIGSKWAAHALLLLFSFGIGYGLSFYYTNLLFNEVEVQRFIASLAVYSIWILFILAITLLAGTIFKKVGGIAGASILVVAILGLSSSLFPKYMGWSPSNAQSQATHYLMTGTWADSFISMVVVSISLLIIIFLLTVYSFKRYESY